MNSREYAGNLSDNERTWSAVIGTALPLLLMRRDKQHVRHINNRGSCGVQSRGEQPVIISNQDQRP